jgi:two-component system sensor histidine kinase HydH
VKIKGGAESLVSFFGAAGIFVFCTVLGYTILKGQLYTNALLARNNGEQTLSLLFAAMREERIQQERSRMGMLHHSGPEMEFSEFTAVLNAYPDLREKIAGIGAYARNGQILFRYAEIPDVSPDVSAAEGGEPLRAYIFDEKSYSLLIVSFLDPNRPRRRRDAENSAAVFLVAVRQNNYWLKNRIAYGVFAGWEILALAAILRIKDILAKNRVYRYKLQEQRQLVALGSAARTLAHEIKNPLSAIQLQADIIGRVCPGSVNNELEAIGQEVRRLRRLTDRVGDFLREPRGTPALLDLGNFAADLVRRSGAEAAITVTEPGIRVLVDPDRLHSIIDNLLRNALESGGGPRTVELRVFRSQGRAILEVLDRGCGLPEGEPERLFNPFFTTKSKGSGVGLSIARRFAEAAGGRLKLENREAGGVRAEVNFPEAGEEAEK